MEDKYTNYVSGHIIVECLDAQSNVLDRYEEHNLIMDKARTAISELACGLTGTAGKPINKFVLGTEGHKSGDYLTPKTSTEGFISSRTMLFSEDSASYEYPIVFTNPGTATGSCTIVSEPNSGSTIDLVHANNNVEYTIEIPATAANSTGIVVYTEAALYAGTNIFSMKCFPAKIKDNTVALRIIWKILF